MQKELHPHECIKLISFCRKFRTLIYKEILGGNYLKMKEKTKEFIKKNFKWLVLFIALIGFLALADTFSLTGRSLR